MERKEAIEVIKKNWPDSSFTMLREALETLIPELKESEDERIRKELLNAFQESEDSLYMVLTPQRRKAFIAWLEKQGNLMKALQISNARIGELIEKNYYLKEQLEKQSKIAPTEDELEALRMAAYEPTKNWSEKLQSLYEKLTNCEQGEQKTTIEMITPEESLGIDSETYSKIVDECVYGEQKPIKEHNACEFCEDRYGCVSPCSMKLIEEEKPTDKVEPKFKVGQTIKKEGFNLGFTIVKIEDGFYYNDIGDYFHFTDQDNWELVEQKPAWSEEDIELLDNTIKFIEDRVAATSPSLRTYSPTLTGKEIPFLKALKDRVQPKQEWSEKDNRMCKVIIDNIKAICEEGYFVGNIDSDELIKWLKSLKERYTWKPNSELDEASYQVGIKRVLENPESYGLTKCDWKPSDEQMNNK